MDLSKMTKAQLIAHMEASYNGEEFSTIFEGTEPEACTRKELIALINEHPTQEPEPPAKPAKMPTPAERRAMKTAKKVHYPRRIGKGIKQTGATSITTGG